MGVVLKGGASSLGNFYAYHTGPLGAKRTACRDWRSYKEFARVPKSNASATEKKLSGIFLGGNTAYESDATPGFNGNFRAKI
jgi:hypothetical protein